MNKAIKLTTALVCVFLSFGYFSCKKKTVSQESKNKKITFKMLLDEIVDREQLAQHPDSLWTQYQASSYQRLSVTPEDTIGWYANHDWCHFERVEENNGRKESVLLDVKGPGVVTRFWMAGEPNRKSALRFYIDGETIPVWEADHPGALIGENKAVGRPLSSRTVEKDDLPINKGAKPGHNLYLPIPFNKSIKITSEEPEQRPEASEAIFYNINYRLYHGNVSVESFNGEIIHKNKASIDAVNKQLLSYQETQPKDAKVSDEENIETISLDLQNGASDTLSLKGNASILRTLLSIKAGNMDTAMKDLWIQFAFDGKTRVDVPVGQLFGVGDQLLPNSDWYRKVDSIGNMASFWVMPYKEQAKVMLVNKGDQTIRAELQVATKTTEWNKSTMYFNGAYAQKLDYEVIDQKGEDYSFANLTSKGVYVGDTYQIHKYDGQWWGEGDEKIYIDGSEFPDHFGTGTEDYYGYAWGHPETFTHPYVTQPIGDANIINKEGITVNTRVRGLDAIPFSKSLKFDMEQWSWFTGTVHLKWSYYWYSL